MADSGQSITRASVVGAVTPARFRIFLAVVLTLAFALLQLRMLETPVVESSLDWAHDGRLHVFVLPDCPHCHDAVAFLKTRADIGYVLHDVATPAGENLLNMVAAQHRIAEAEIGVPLFVFGDRYLIGFDSADTSGQDLVALTSAEGGTPSQSVQQSRINLPIFGEIDPSRYSLPALTVVLALADGFNPCAMWVLVYLISLVAGLQEREKIWWVVGTFVVTSGILYFLFMTAWLNTFLILGYIRPLTQLVALAAIGFGASHLYELAWNRGEAACEVGDVEQRQRTMRHIREVVTAPVGFASLALVTGLAFSVNAIEFVCSAALPAIYTHTLVLADLSMPAYYGYITLYVLIFMLDDLIIFGLAAFAVQKVVDTRYAAVSRGAGGMVLLGLGLWMLTR